MHQTLVDRDPFHPEAELGFAAVSADLADHLDERVLEHVLRERLRREHPTRQREHARREEPVDLGVRSPVAVLRAGKHGGIKLWKRFRHGGTNQFRCPGSKNGRGRDSYVSDSVFRAPSQDLYTLEPTVPEWRNW